MTDSQQAYRDGYNRIVWKPMPQIDRKPIAESKRADLACPMVVSDALPDGTYSGADGQVYTSKAALRASYLPGGNPRGLRFEEVGNEKMPPPPPIKTDDKAIDAAIHKAAAQAGVSL